MPDAQLARALGKAANPILIVDRSGAVMWCNNAYSELVHIPADGLLRKKPHSLTPSKESARYLSEIWDIVMAGQIWKGELLERSADGVTIYMDAVMTPLDDAHGRPALFMLFLHDVSQRKAEYDKVWTLANHDRLTGLANRGFFLSMLTHSLAVAERNKLLFAVLYIDLDGFKAANDTFGHAVGDQVLVRVGEIFKQTVRRSDVVARMGGDEFACILLDIKAPSDAGLVASKLLSALALMREVGGHDVHIGASIGVSLYPANGTSESELVERADAAMYEAKAAGKNCWRQTA